MEERFDVFNYKNDVAYKKTKEGYKIVKGALLTKYGVYGEKDKREYRPKDEVINEKFIQSFFGKPITIKHPQSVDKDNFQTQIKGCVLNAYNNEGEDCIRGDLIIYDTDDIQGYNELSVGYDCVVVEEEGEFEGEKYKAKLTDLYVNHVAIVNKSKIGKETSIVLDGEIQDNSSLKGEQYSGQHSQENKKSQTNQTSQANKNLRYIQDDENMENNDEAKQKLEKENKVANEKIESLQKQITELQNVNKQLKEENSKKDILSKIKNLGFNINGEIDKMTTRDILQNFLSQNSGTTKDLSNVTEDNLNFAFQILCDKKQKEINEKKTQQEGYNEGQQENKKISNKGVLTGFEYTTPGNANKNTFGLSKEVESMLVGN